MKRLSRALPVVLAAIFTGTLWACPMDGDVAPLSTSDATTSDAEDAATSCPDIAGTWTIVEHCEASAVGLQTTITQQQCWFSATTEGQTYVGSLETDGSFSVSFDVEGTPWTCTGQVSGKEITETCNGTCGITLVMFDP